MPPRLPPLESHSRASILAIAESASRALYTNSYNICSSTAENCGGLYKFGERIDGVYTIDPDGSGSIDVSCDHTTAGGGWTVFQRRLDGSVDFYRGWADYKSGFGSLTGEFWLGLDKINKLTGSGKHKLRVDLEDTEGNTVYAEYDLFVVANEGTKYQLSVGNYSGVYVVVATFVTTFALERIFNNYNSLN